MQYYPRGRYNTGSYPPTPTCFIGGGSERLSANLNGYVQPEGEPLVVDVAGSLGDEFRVGLDKGNTGTVSFYTIWQNAVEFTFPGSYLLEPGDRIVVEARGDNPSVVSSFSWVAPRCLIASGTIEGSTLSLTVSGEFDEDTGQRNYLIYYEDASRNQIGMFAYLSTRDEEATLSLDISALPSTPEWLTVFAYDEKGLQPFPGTKYFLNPGSVAEAGIGFWIIETDFQVQ